MRHSCEDSYKHTLTMTYTEMCWHAQATSVFTLSCIGTHACFVIHIVEGGGKSSFCTFVRTLGRALLVRSRESPPLRTGLSYCILLLVANATQTAVLHQYFHRQFRLGMRLRAAVSALIYRKALKIQSGALSAAWEASGSSEGRGSSGGRTTGQYVNLLAVDAQRLQDLMTYVHILWSAPLQICIALFLLFRLLGLAAFGGLAVMLLNGPLTGVLWMQLVSASVPHQSARC